MPSFPFLGNFSLQEIEVERKPKEVEIDRGKPSEPFTVFRPYRQVEIHLQRTKLVSLSTTEKIVYTVNPRISPPPREFISFLYFWLGGY